MSASPAWVRGKVALPDLELVYYTAGAAVSPPVVFINGGPGDDHRYLRPVAAHFADAHRVVLYDQRGCGESALATSGATTLNIKTFVDDLDALRLHLGAEQIALVGHSWGAMLALCYAHYYPARVAGQALVALGPLTLEMSGIALANTLKLLSADERRDYERLSAERRVAIAAGNRARQAELHKQRTTTYTTRAWFYDPAARERFNAEWLALYNYNPDLGRPLMADLRTLNIFERVQGLDVRTLVLYGAQDYCPLMQAYLLKERMPNTQIALLNECGHVPWMEKPEAFYRIVGAFLQYTE